LVRAPIRSQREPVTRCDQVVDPQIRGVPRRQLVKEVPSLTVAVKAGDVHNFGPRPLDLEVSHGPAADDNARPPGDTGHQRPQRLAPIVVGDAERVVSVVQHEQARLAPRQPSYRGIEGRPPDGMSDAFLGLATGPAVFEIRPESPVNRMAILVLQEPLPGRPRVGGAPAGGALPRSEPADHRHQAAGGELALDRRGGGQMVRAHERTRVFRESLSGRGEPALGDGFLAPGLQHGSRTLRDEAPRDQGSMSIGVPVGTLVMAAMVSGLARMQPWDEATPLVDAGSEG
jgi:hypothetical protein